MLLVKEVDRETPRDRGIWPVGSRNVVVERDANKTPDFGGNRSDLRQHLSVISFNTSRPCRVCVYEYYRWKVTRNGLRGIEDLADCQISSARLYVKRNANCFDEFLCEAVLSS